MNTIEWITGYLKPSERRALLECWCEQGGWVEIRDRHAIVASGELFFIDEEGYYIEPVTNHDVVNVAIKLAK